MDNQNAARAGEYFVCYALEQRGIRATKVDLVSDDLWVRTPSNRLLTVQVKTATSLSSRRAKGKPRYHFHNGNRGQPSKADLFAFVALPLSCLIIEDSMGYSRALTTDKFTPAAMEESIARYLY